jgi:hypothetical protein
VKKRTAGPCFKSTGLTHISCFYSSRLSSTSFYRTFHVASNLSCSEVYTKQKNRLARSRDANG